MKDFVGCDVPNPGALCHLGVGKVANFGISLVSGFVGLAHGIGDSFREVARDNPSTALLVALPLAYVFYQNAGAKACGAFVESRRNSKLAALRQQYPGQNGQPLDDATLKSRLLSPRTPKNLRASWPERIAQAVPNNLVHAGAICASLVAGTTVADVAIYQGLRPGGFGRAIAQERTLGYMNYRTEQAMNWVTQAIDSVHP